MIASQLGAVYASGGDTESNRKRARTHCKEYAETYVNENGEVVHLTDWRLPTAAEIDIIIKHQHASDAMAEVLSGSRYYCAYNIENGQPIHTKSSEGGNSGSCHVRCIRDAY